MEAQRTQKELNMQMAANRTNGELASRMDRIEKNIELILELLVKENIKPKKK